MYHKAVLDKKSPASLARLAKQAANMYGEVSAIFNQPALASHFERSWVAHTQMKVRARAVHWLTRRMHSLLRRMHAAACDRSGKGPQQRLFGGCH